MTRQGIIRIGGFDTSRRQGGIRSKFNVYIHTVNGNVEGEGDGILGMMHALLLTRA